MTTAVCFDLDGTLIHFDRPYDEIVADVFAAHGIDRDPARHDAGREAFRTAFDALEPNPQRAAMAAVVEDAGADADPDAMVRTLLEYECEHSTVREGTVDCLDALAEDGPLGVITNGEPDWQRRKLAHHGLAEYFEAIVASYEAGAHKPDPAPFDRLRERIDAEEYVMVGNDYEGDVEGARSAGFVPIHYEDEDGPSFWQTLRAMV
ncbi:HAD family hydrolase [Halomicroarcula sp. GCM10025709]|uniref:HAD family hydrolase n=1 Tax=Haloarcula TaxID=2237 RepID=UPI0024C23FD3|nr:HAD family hydrolase [Halomicroarcula sp. YJ-61-S]